MDLPADVLRFLGDAAPLRTDRLRINPLSPHQCALQTGQVREIPIGAELGLVVLDDADDSNPHCLITAGPASGMVVHFCHDPEPTLCYQGLTHFLDALRSARDNGVDIDKLPKLALTPHANQSDLVAHLRSYLARDDSSATTLLHIHYPLLDPERVDVLVETAGHADFLVRETAARFVDVHRRPGHRRVAETLAADPYPQVAEPARRALRALGAAS
jgi:hypothetical protein